jgi:hypothetical protein
LVEFADELADPGLVVVHPGHAFGVRKVGSEQHALLTEQVHEPTDILAVVMR